MTVMQRAGDDSAARERKRCWGFLDWFCRLAEVLRNDGDDGDPCVTIPGRIIAKPDPCIYTQFLLQQLDQPVTWDNPDVRIFRNGVEQDTYNLQADTRYDIEVTVHNSSRNKPAMGTTVIIKWIEFGAGGKVRHPIATVSVDVPLWPGTAMVPVQWTTPATPGHYCIEVELAHPDDGNPTNNLGWNNTQVHAANSPVDVAVRIFNQYPDGCPPIREGGPRRVKGSRLVWGWGLLGLIAGASASTIDHTVSNTPIRAFWFALVGFGLAGLVGFVSEWLALRLKNRREKEAHQHDRVSCHYVELSVDSYQFQDDVGKDFDPAQAFAANPPEWPATVTPSSFMFATGEPFKDVTLHVDAPDLPGPPGVFNVNAQQGGAAAGGVTVTIERGAA